MNEHIFYTYIYLDSRKFGCYMYGNYIFEAEPLYVGKGRDKQMNTHLLYVKNKKSEKWITNRYKHNKIKKILDAGLEPIVFKVKDYLTEQQAFDLEIDLIKNIGKGLDGPLTNYTNGGEGISGWNHSEETRNKIGKSNSISLKGKFIGENHPMFGKHHTEESKMKMSIKSKTPRVRSEEEKLRRSNSMKGRIVSPETRAKLAAASSGVVFSPERKAKISESKKGIFPSQETRQKLSKSLTGHFSKMKGKTIEELYGVEKANEIKKKTTKYKDQNPFFGRKHSPESLAKMRSSHEKTRLRKAKKEYNG